MFNGKNKFIGDKMRYNKKFTLKTGEVITISSATARDAEKVCSYENSLFAETKFFTRGPEEGDVSVGDCKGYIEKQNKPRNAFLIVKLNKQVIAHVSLNQKSKHLRMMHRSEFGIGVLKKHWGKGIAGILITEIINLARSYNYEQIELAAVKENTRAIKLYKSFGFVKYGELINSFKYTDGSYQNAIYMVKTLNKKEEDGI